MKNLKELRDKRGKAVADARAILDKADAEKRALTEDEKRQVDAFMTEAVNIKAEIETEERVQDAERELAASGLRNVETPENRSGSQVDPNDEKRMQAFRKVILDGPYSLSAEEKRDLTAGSDTQGGYLLAPMEFINQLIVRVKNLVFIRDLATVIPLANNASCGAPSLETDVDDPTWTSEIGATVQDAGTAFGRRELTPHMLSKLVKVSIKLLLNAALDPEAIIMDRLAYKFGVAMEKAYLTGNGVSQPLGVFTASADGIPTTQDIYMPTGNTTTLNADGLIAAKYNLKAQYMAKAKWVFHRNAIAQIAQLKTGDGEYIFNLSDTPNVPDMLLGRPLLMSEYAPNTFTAGSYIGMFADFTHYWIADSMALQFIRLNELYQTTSEIGFIGRLSTDAMPVLPEAFTRIALSQS
jgi:HK97 family phage major capsid protein